MKTKYTIPATKDMGTCEIVGTSSTMESCHDNALWEYNSMREHDGLPPVERLPDGTKAERL